MDFRTKLGLWLVGKDTGQLLTAVEQTFNATIPSRGTQELIQAYNTSPWLKAVIGLIAADFAAVPWQLFALRTVDPERSKALGRTVYRYHKTPTIRSSANPTQRKALYKQAENQGMERVEITSHPFLDLLCKPNPMLTGLQARKICRIHQELKGEAFWAIERASRAPGISARNVPVEYWPLNPAWVKERPTSAKPFYKVEVPGQVPISIPQEDMVAFYDPDPDQIYGRGSGRGEALGDEIDTDEYAAKFVKTTFVNKARPEMFVSVEGAKAPQLQAAKRRFEMEHAAAGIAGRGQRSFWHGGEVKVHELTKSFVDLDMNNLRTWERDAFINVFGIPPEKLGVVGSSNRATSEVADLTMAKQVIVPRLEADREILQNQLVDQFDERLILDYEDPTPDDRDRKLEAMKTFPYAFRLNELREMGGVEPIDELEGVHMVPINVSSQTSEEIANPLPMFQIESSPDGQLLEGDEEQTRALTAPKQKTLLQQHVQEVLIALDIKRLRDELEPVMRSQIEDWGNNELESIGATLDFNMTNPAVVDHLDKFAGERLEFINDHTRDRLADTLKAGVELGEGVDEITKRVQDVFVGIGKGRARTIARTEVARSANFGTLQAHKDSGVVKMREWIVTPDGGRHHAAGLGDNITASIDEPFHTPVGIAMHPGDFGDPAQVANCRCTTAAIIEGDEARSAQQSEMEWKRFDAGLRPWEKAMENATNLALVRQMNDVVRRINELSSNNV